MKVSIIQENLNKSLGIVGRAISTKSNLEILSHILLKTEEGRLKLSATNLEIGISAYVGTKIEKKGEITVPARLFIDFINSLPNKKIDIEIKENDIEIKSENFESTIKGISAEEFPLIPQAKKGEPIKIKKEDLKEALQLVCFAAAMDETRPVLSGVYLNIKEDVLTLATTDSYRLAEKKVKLKNKNKEIDAVVPVRSMIELARIIEGEGEIEMFLDENQCFFRFDDIEFTTRLIEGTFPNYKQIIPKEGESKAKIKRDKLLSAVKVASLFSRETTNSVRLDIKQKGEVDVISPESQSGESTTSVEAEVEGRGGTVLFNGKYIQEALSNMKGDEVIFEMSDGINACVVRSEKNEDYIYVVMPLRT